MHIRHYLAALDVVNTKRNEMGLPPLDHLPEGTPGDPARCAIARAIPGAHVHGDSLSSFAENDQSRLADLAAFIHSFDTESQPGSTCDPGTLVDGGIEDDKGTLVPA